MEVKVKKLQHDVRLPTYQHDGDAGMDLFSCQDCVLLPGEITAVSTGVQIAIPRGYVGLVWDKSGLSLAAIHCLAGVVDAGYRGEVRVVTVNMGKEPFRLSKGMKIAQLLIQPVVSASIVEVEELDETTRGHGGFGSTGLY